MKFWSLCKHDEWHYFQFQSSCNSSSSHLLTVVNDSLSFSSAFNLAMVFFIATLIALLCFDWVLFRLYSACQVCTPNATNTVWSHCQCVLADGVERGILTANRMIPGPSIQVCENDKVVVDVENHMEGMEVTIHWHGIWQRGSQYYDGVPFVTQCPIQQGNTFRWVFTC